MERPSVVITTLLPLKLQHGLGETNVKPDRQIFSYLTSKKKYVIYDDHYGVFENQDQLLVPQELIMDPTFPLVEWYAIQRGTQHGINWYQWPLDNPWKGKGQIQWLEEAVEKYLNLFQPYPGDTDAPKRDTRFQCRRSSPDVIQIWDTHQGKLFDLKVELLTYRMFNLNNWYRKRLESYTTTSWSFDSDCLDVPMFGYLTTVMTDLDALICMLELCHRMATFCDFCTSARPELDAFTTQKYTEDAKRLQGGDITPPEGPADTSVKLPWTLLYLQNVPEYQILKATGFIITL
ncbi:hypothetical protein BDZ89DRAFT_1052131 [Hymenopellis radicata]|nr:hypothetical protein BDZ89DRAFT_1052131 [Hymenopellis radicata]